MMNKESRSCRLLLSFEKTEGQQLKEAYLTDSAEALAKLKEEEKAEKKRIFKESSFGVRVIAASLGICLLVGTVFVLLFSNAGMIFGGEKSSEEKYIVNMHEIIQLPQYNSFELYVSDISSLSDVNGVYFTLEGIEITDGYFYFDLLLHNESKGNIYTAMDTQLQKYIEGPTGSLWRDLTPEIKSEESGNIPAIATMPAIWGENILSQGETWSYRCNMKYYGASDPSVYRYGVAFEIEEGDYVKNLKVYFEFNLKGIPESDIGSANDTPMTLPTYPNSDLRDIYALEIGNTSELCEYGTMGDMLVNGDRIVVGGEVSHLRVFKLDSVSDLNVLKKVLDDIWYDSGEIFSHMDEEYFNEYTLYIVYHPTAYTGGSRVLSDIDISDQEICLKVKCLESGSGEAVSGWLHSVAFPNEGYSSVTMIDAIYINED